MCNPKKKPLAHKALISRLGAANCPADARVLTLLAGEMYIPPAHRQEVSDAILKANNRLTGVVGAEATEIADALLDTTEAEEDSEDNPGAEAAEAEAAKQTRGAW